jgi:molybdenum cofactor cytidylyltransferase
LAGVGAIVLAAGGSSRMSAGGGAPKQLLLYAGKTLLRHAVDAVLEAGCRPVVVVIGASADRVQAELGSLPVTVAPNADWDRGIGTSIRAGVGALRALEPEIGAALIALCDQPVGLSDAVRAIVSTFRQSGALIVASEYEGTVGPPALFRRDLFDELLHLADAEGAKRIIQSHRADAIAIPCPESAVDVDTPEDYRSLQSREPY